MWDRYEEVVATYDTEKRIVKVIDAVTESIKPFDLVLIINEAMLIIIIIIK